MPVISRLSTVNQALLEIGRPKVSNINDSSDSKLMDSKIDILLPLMLQYEDWNFAIKYVSDNTPITQPFTPDYQNTYQLPYDYGRMFSWGNFDNNFADSSAQPFLITDGLISTNDMPANYYYIVNDIDVSAVSTMFWRALVLYIASDSALVLTQNTELTGYLKKKYDDALIDATSRNGMERFVVSKPYNSFNRSDFV